MAKMFEDEWDALLQQIEEAKALEPSSKIPPVIKPESAKDLASVSNKELNQAFDVFHNQSKFQTNNPLSSFDRPATPFSSIVSPADQDLFLRKLQQEAKLTGYSNPRSPIIPAGSTAKEIEALQGPTKIGEYSSSQPEFGAPERAAKEAEARLKFDAQRQSYANPRSKIIPAGLTSGQAEGLAGAKIQSSSGQPGFGSILTKEAEENLGSLDWWANQPETRASINEALEKLPEDLKAAKNWKDPNWQKKALDWINKRNEQKVASAMESVSLQQPENIVKNLIESPSASQISGSTLSGGKGVSSAAALSTPEAIAKAAPLEAALNRRDAYIQDVVKRAAAISKGGNVKQEAKIAVASIKKEIAAQKAAQKAAEAAAKKQAADAARAAKAEALKPKPISVIPEVDETGNISTPPKVEEPVIKAQATTEAQAAQGASKIEQEAAQMGADKSTGGSGATAKAAEETAEHASGTAAKAATKVEENAEEAGRVGKALRAQLSKIPGLEKTLKTIDDSQLLKFVRSNPWVAKGIKLGGGAMAAGGALSIPGNILGIGENLEDMNRPDVSNLYRLGKGLSSAGKGINTLGTTVDLAAAVGALPTGGGSLVGFVPGLAMNATGLGMEQLGEYIAEKNAPIAKDAAGNIDFDALYKRSGVTPPTPQPQGAEQLPEMHIPKPLSAKAINAISSPDFKTPWDGQEIPVNLGLLNAKVAEQAPEEPKPEVPVAATADEGISQLGKEEPAPTVEEQNKLEQELETAKSESPDVVTPDIKELEDRVVSNRLKLFKTSLDLKKAKPIIDAYTKAGQDENVDPYLLMGNAFKESAFKSGIKNIGGTTTAEGFGQVTRPAYKELQDKFPDTFGKVSFEQMNKDDNLQVLAHTKYFGLKLKQADGDTDKALRYYYQGVTSNKELNDLADKGLNRFGKPLQDIQLKNGKVYTVDQQKADMRNGGWDGPEADKYVAQTKAFANEFRKLAGMPITEEPSIAGKGPTVPSSVAPSDQDKMPLTAPVSEEEPSVADITPGTKPSTAEDELRAALSGTASRASYADLLDMVRRNRFSADMGAAVANIIAGTSAMAYKAPVKNVSEDFYKQMRENALDPLKDREMEEKLADMDPESAESRLSQKLLGEALKQAGFKNIDLSKQSKNDLEKRFSEIMSLIKVKKAQQNVDNFKDYKMAAKALENVSGNMVTKLTQNKTANTDASNIARAQNLFNLVGTSRILTPAEVDKVLYTQDKDGKKILNPEVINVLDQIPANVAEEAVMDVARIITGSAPTMTTIKNLNLPTLESGIAGIKNYLGSNAADAAYKGQVISSLLKLSARVAQNSQERLFQDAQGYIASKGQFMRYSMGGVPLHEGLLNSLKDRLGGSRLVHPNNWGQVQAFKNEAKKVKLKDGSTLLDKFTMDNGLVDYGAMEDYMYEREDKLPQKYKLKPIKLIDIDPYTLKHSVSTLND